MITIKGLKARWQSASPAVKASVCFTLAMFLQKGLVTLSTPIFTRIMTTVEYEQYTVYYAWSGMLSIVATLNLSSGVLNNLLVQGKHSRDAIVSALQGLASVWALGSALVFAGLRLTGIQLGSLPADLWFAMLLSFVVTPAYELWVVGQRFTFDYRKTCLFMVLIALANLVVPLVCVLNASAKGEARILATILINAAVGAGFWLNNWRKGRSMLLPSVWKAALAFNLPLIPHFLSLTILNQSDKIMIERMCQPGQAAIYSVAHTVAAAIQLLMTAANYSLVPWTYQRLKQRRYGEIAGRSDQILLAVAVMISGIMLFTPEIMRIMAPEKYMEAVYIIPSMTAGIYFGYLYQFFGRIELYHQKKTLMTLGSVGGAAVNIVLNLICIRRFGYMAAAYTTLLCQMLLCVIHCLMARRIVFQQGYEQSPFHYRRIIAISLIPLATAFVAPLFYAHWYARWTIIAVLALALIVWRKKAVGYLKVMLKNPPERQAAESSGDIDHGEVQHDQ